MKTTVEIDEPVFDQIKRLAHEEGVSFRVLVDEGLRAVLELRRARSTSVFRLRDGSFSGQGLLPGVEPSDLTRLAYENTPGSWPRP